MHRLTRSFCPIINGQYQQEGKSHSADVLNANIGGEVETFQLEMAKAYDLQEMSQFTRTFTWVKEPQPNQEPRLIIEDIFRFEKTPESIIERFITPISTITEETDGIVLHGKQNLRVIYDRNLLHLKINPLEFFNHFGKKESAIALDLKLVNPQKTCEFKIVFQFE